MKGRPIKSSDRVPILGPVTWGFAVWTRMLARPGCGTGCSGRVMMAGGCLPAALLAKGAQVLAAQCRLRLVGFLDPDTGQSGYWPWIQAWPGAGPGSRGQGQSVLDDPPFVLGRRRLRQGQFGDGQS
jgi:hypothetical protein